VEKDAIAPNIHTAAFRTGFISYCFVTGAESWLGIIPTQ
jgi:hypothetical protein